jgi:hypothetical protein
MKRNPNTVSVLVWGREAAEFLDSIRETCDALVPPQRVAFEPSLDGLSRHLMEHRGEEEVVILMPASMMDLANLLKQRELLEGLRSIVILPFDQRDVGDLMDSIHALRPRFVAQATRDLDDVTAVLKNLLRSGEQNAATVARKSRSRAS